MSDIRQDADLPLSSRVLNRRTLLKSAGLGAFGLAMRGPLLQGSDDHQQSVPASQSMADLPPLNRFGRMVQEYWVRRIGNIERNGTARRAALRTRADAETYLRDVRQKIGRCFGPWPRKTPLNARITGVVRRDAYHIEKVIFESRPSFHVTANLYVPAGRHGRLPGVVGTCGHMANGKAAEAYQSFAQGLARQGYIVLIYDPFRQGERRQYSTPGQSTRLRTSVQEHLQAGNQQLLVDEWIGTWMAWDGIRALDYLLTRPEVDPAHLGVTGNSGGGTQTAWLCAADPRWTMAAPSCFVTTFRRNLENELPADTEQCPPGAFAMELDHADFVAAMAPRPLLLLGQELDFFDVRGLEEAYERLRHLYGLLGAEQNVRLFIGPDRHGYSQPNREAMYGWFNQCTGIASRSVEAELIMEKEETLWCTPHGRLDESGTATIFTFTRDRALEFARRRGRLEGETLRSAIVNALRLPAQTDAAPPEYRILRPSRGRRWPLPHAGTYAVETEPGIHAIVHRLSDTDLRARPPRGAGRAILYVAHHSADRELRTEPLILEIMRAEPDLPVFTCDLRGIGESRPNTTGEDFLAANGSDYFYSVHGVMDHNPYPRQRTLDLLRVLDWLRANGHETVHLLARGWGAVPAAFAAVLSDTVVQVTLKHALTSYNEIAQCEDYRWPLSCLVPRVLKLFDMPDCYRALEAKRLRQIDPWGPMDGYG